MEIPQTDDMEFKTVVSRGHFKDKGVAVFTSGGDAQGNTDNSTIIFPSYFTFMCVFRFFRYECCCESSGQDGNLSRSQGFFDQRRLPGND